MTQRKRQLWYEAGLHFECQGCGNCCSGPEEGYIWVTRREIDRIAKALKISVDEFRRKYCRRVGLRTTIVEHPETRDCIFLKKIAGQKRCVIYEVRPTQCRTWPFWSSNLRSGHAWNEATHHCPGINRGQNHVVDEIERRRRMKDWRDDDEK